MARICFLSGDITRAGGTERVASAIANGLATRGHDVLVLSLIEERSEPAYRLSGAIRRRAMYDAPFTFKTQYPRIVRYVRRLLRDESVDVLVDIDTILSIVSIPAAFSLPTKTVSWEHFHYAENLGSRARDVGRWLAMRYGHAVITLTRADKQRFIDAGSRAPVHQIYNPVTEPWRGAEYDNSRTTIMSAGRLTYQKGFDMVPAIAEQVLGGRAEWRWVIYGDGPERDRIEAEVQARGMDGRVILAGQTSDIDSAYREAALFVLTSRFEGLVMVLLEALTHGVPCVAFECPSGPDEIITEGENGYLIPCFDTSLMAARLRFLVDNHVLRRQFSDATKEAIAPFELEAIIDRWEEVIR